MSKTCLGRISELYVYIIYVYVYVFLLTQNSYHPIMQVNMFLDDILY